MLADNGCQDWWKLTPDEFGSYVNGTWTQLASLPDGYSPLYHASAVLPDGRVIIEGGEYIFSNGVFNPVWSDQGAIYDPLANTWTSVAPPPFFGGFGPFPRTIGDAQSVVLFDGTFMLANCPHPRHRSARCKNSHLDADRRKQVRRSMMKKGGRCCPTKRC